MHPHLIFPACHVTIEPTMTQSDVSRLLYLVLCSFIFLHFPDWLLTITASLRMVYLMASTIAPLWISIAAIMLILLQIYWFMVTSSKTVQITTQEQDSEF